MERREASWELGDWEPAKRFVEKHWPNADQRGVGVPGVWRVRGDDGYKIVADIYYSIGRVTFVPRFEWVPLPEIATP